MRNTRTLPPPRPIQWELRSISTAKVSFNILQDYRLHISIEHAALRGVTPVMLSWWFGNIEGTMEYGGKTYPRYQVWHPLDHISFRVVQPSLDGTVGPGARIHIVEAFGRNPQFLVDEVATVQQRDERGAQMVKRILGAKVFELSNTFVAVEEGTKCHTQMVVGVASRLGALLINRYIRPRLFSNAMAKAWIRHQVEEVGNLEHFLPELYATCAASEV